MAITSTSWWTGDFFWKNLLFPLFDASGGRGVETTEWLKSFVSSNGIRMVTGYAGGLGPDNVAQEVERISKVVDDDDFFDSTIWIDMETKLRIKTATGDRFDLEKCEQVLQAVQSWVG